VDLLRSLYTRIVIPVEEFEELTASGAPPEVAAWLRSRPHWVEVRASQRFDDYKSLELVRAQVSRGCTGRPTGQTIWYYTPTEGPEFRDVLGSVASAVMSIHTSQCLQAGISPSAEFWGYGRPCVYDLRSSAYRQVDWTQVDRVMIRGEGWLKAGCANGVAGYQKFVATVTGYLRAHNPRIQVYAHTSLRYTPPAMIGDDSGRDSSANSGCRWVLTGISAVWGARVLHAGEPAGSVERSIAKSPLRGVPPGPVPILAEAPFWKAAVT